MSRFWSPIIAAASWPHEPEPGQGMVEYGLVIAAIAIAVIVAIFSLGPQIASLFSSAAGSLG